MRRGQLRIYLGAAPGVGKTFAMLNEGGRRAARGTDVVIGYVETHGRAHTSEQIGELEAVPRRCMEYRGAVLEEMDVDAVLARQPQVALVDELAHTNVPGSRNEKRWQDAEELLAAGIDVISTVNIQHLESMNDVVEEITGIHQQETIPDSFVRSAEQVELVDATPEALRRRMAHGNIYPAERIDAALTNYFRPGNLGALRELALMWVADKVDDALIAYREQHGIAKPWETRERVVVALTGAPHGIDLIRRAARVASRSHGELVGVHVRSSDGLSSGPTDALTEQRRLLDDLGGTYHEVAGADVARSLTHFAHGQNATQIVLGASGRSRWAEIVSGSVINDVLRRSGTIDVHVISTQAEARDESGSTAGGVHLRRNRLRFSGRRITLAWLIAVFAPLLVTFVLARVRDHVALPTDLLLYLLVVVGVAAIGGIAPAAFAAVVSFLFANWYFTPPIHRFTVAEPQNLFALFVFVAVAIVVGSFVAEAARRTAEAARARSEAETLAALAATIGSDDDPLSAIVEQVRVAFGATAVSVLRGSDEAWRTEAAAGSHAPSTPSEADLSLPLAPGAVVAVRSPGRDAVDVPTLRAFVTQLGVALERRHLRAAAASAARLAEVSDLRAALLAAVSHDLRTPLASIKASVSTLRQGDIEWSEDDRTELLETIEISADRLTELVTNLLGMSRIQAGTVELATRDVDLEEVVSRAVVGLDTRGHDLKFDLEGGVSAVSADAALLERAIANVIDNALKWSPPGGSVWVRSDEHSDRVVLLVVDQGPGIPVADRARIFEPFQRVGDRPTVAGTGLGLAVARGFVELMGGELEVDDTPGGGTTMVISLPAAR